MHFLIVQLLSHLLSPLSPPSLSLRIDQWQIGAKLPFSPACHQSLASSALLPIIAKTTRMVRTKKNCCCCSSSLFAAVASQLCQNEEDKSISGPRARKEFRPWSACFCQGCILGRMHVCMRSLLGGTSNFCFFGKKRSLFSSASAANQLILNRSLFSCHYHSRCFSQNANSQHTWD